MIRKAGRAEVSPSGIISACPACGCAAVEQSLAVGYNWQSLRSGGTFVAAVPTHRSQAQEAPVGLTATLASRRERWEGNVVRM